MSLMTMMKVTTMMKTITMMMTAMTTLVGIPAEPPSLSSLRSLYRALAPPVRGSCTWGKSQPWDVMIIWENDYQQENSSGLGLKTEQAKLKAGVIVEILLCGKTTNPI